MKRKIDFVTNSSSVNFIISKLKGYKNEPNIEITIKVNLDRFVRERLSSVAEAEQYLLEYGFAKDDLETENYCIKILNEVKEGNEVLILNASNNGDPEESFLCDNGLPDKIEGFKVIQGEGGY